MSYIARVELMNGPTAQDYENLHEAMKKQSFLRTITSFDKHSYQLPDAEYIWETTSDKLASEIRDSLQIAISAIYSKKFLLLVSRTTSIAWHLDPAK